MKMLLIFLSAACLESRALYYLGVREDGFNKGQHVEDLQKKCGLQRGEPYCACYVFIKHHECGITDLPRFYNRAASWGRADKIVWRRGDATDAIQEGMVVLLGDSPETAFHNGTVFKGPQEDDNGWYILYDSGNTRSNNIIAGEGVHLVKIYLRNVCAIADWITPRGQEPVKYHYVQSKQNLYRIGLLYKISVNEIKRMNNLESDIVYIGQKLRVG